MAELKVELERKNEEIRQLRVQTESLERIREVEGTPRDVLNKAHFFNNDIKTKGQVSVAKIIPILVSFIMKMEAALVDIWKLVSGSATGESRWPLKKTPLKEKPLEEVKNPLLQQLVKELVAGLAKIGRPPTTELLAATPTVVKVKKIGMDSETPKTTSSEPSSQKKSMKKGLYETSHYWAQIQLKHDPSFFQTVIFSKNKNKNRVHILSPDLPTC